MRVVKIRQPSLADRIDAVLPQTQCTRCGYAACRPYAEAVAEGAAEINRCPPGGEPVVIALAALTGRAARPVDPDCGAHGPLLVAVIDEATCIGCTLCIEACPVDAILGAQKRMHTVLPSLCTGCELCVAPCPVDCITLRPSGRTWTDHDADSARQRFVARAARLVRNERVAKHAVPAAPFGDHDRARRQAAVADALARARARRATSTPLKS
jgi:electron transport complex protein RnfB